MSRILMRALRAITTATLIGGSVFVQHVARAECGRKHAELQRHAGIGSETCSMHNRERQAVFHVAEIIEIMRSATLAKANAP